MANIDKRPDRRWREYAGGAQKVRHFARKRDAEQFLDAIRSDLARGMYVDPAGGRMLFREYAERWRSIQVQRSGTTPQVETYLGLHAYPSSALTRWRPPRQRCLGMGERAHGGAGAALAGASQ